MGILSVFNGLFRSSRIERPSVYRPLEQPKPMVYGSHGRLEIPSLSISVPLYNAFNGADRQRVVDEPYSAVFFKLGVQDVIADHANQANFQNLNLATPGVIATIDDGIAPKSYQMVQSQVGHISIASNGNRLFDHNWQQVSTQNNGGLCIYTCIGKSSDDVMDVRLTYWRLLNK